MKLSKTSRRTVVLALLAAVGFVYSAIVHFDIEPAVMLNFFKMSLVLVFIAAVFAAICVALLHLIRKIKS